MCYNDMMKVMTSIHFSVLILAGLICVIEMWLLYTPRKLGSNIGPLLDVIYDPTRHPLITIAYYSLIKNRLGMVKIVIATFKTLPHSDFQQSMVIVMRFFLKLILRFYVASLNRRNKIIFYLKSVLN